MVSALIHLATDRELLEACATRAGLRSIAESRICWIRNTMELSTLAASTPLLAAAHDHPDLRPLTGPVPLPFDARGNLPDLLPGLDDSPWNAAPL